MTCDRAPQLSAYLDGELDLSATLDLESHLETCPACAAQLAAHRALHEAIAAADLRHHPSPEQLRRLRRAVRGRSAPAAPTAAGAPPASRTLRLPATPRLRAAAAIFLVAAAGWLVGRRWPAPLPPTAAPTAADVAPSDVAEQVVASHVRALLAGRPADVVSTDRHTVKPWFAGRLDYAPPVLDLAPAGFPLLGGRLEYLAGQPVAALVYRAGNHLVSLFVWPATRSQAPAGAPAPPSAGPARTPTRTSARRGYQLRTWTQSNMTWWAVSDAAPEALDAFTRALKAASSSS